MNTRSMLRIAAAVLATAAAPRPGAAQPLSRCLVPRGQPLHLRHPEHAAADRRRHPDAATHHRPGRPIPMPAATTTRRR